MGSFSESIVIDADAAEVWASLADIGGIARWNPGLVASHLVSEDRPEGVGARRHCDLPRGSFLLEEVVEWEPARALTMRIVETDLPISADIRFTLAPLPDDRTEVTVSPRYSAGYGPIGWIADLLFIRRTYRRGMRSLLEGLARDATGR